MNINLLKLAIAGAYPYATSSPVCLNMESHWYYEQDDFELRYICKQIFDPSSAMADEIFVVAA